MYPVSSIHYPVSSIQNPVSCIKFNILYPVSCILYPVSCILWPVSCILYPVSCILYPVSYSCTDYIDFIIVNILQVNKVEFFVLNWTEQIQWSGNYRKLFFFYFKGIESLPQTLDFKSPPLWNLSICTGLHVIQSDPFLRMSFVLLCQNTIRGKEL